MRATRRIHGISLIESLIALVVLSFGLLAIGKLLGDLVATTGTTKARAEAVQLAESRIEAMRSAVLEAQFDGLVGNTTRTENGVNAQFSLASSVQAITAEHLDLRVLVTWTDAKGKPQQVRVNSEVAWKDPRASLLIAMGALSDGNLIQRPTGTADAGGELLDTDDITDNVIAGTEHGDGTQTRKSGDKTQLVTADGEVLMTMETSTPGQNFSVVTGKVYFDMSTITMGTDQNEVYPPDVRIMSSDTSVCTRVFANGADPGTGTSSGYALFQDDSPYRYFYYRCYVGEGWYGNVSVLRLDSSPLNQRVCVGDPNVAQPAAGSENLFNRHPTLETGRKYRGYIARNPDDPAAGYTGVGIGLNPDFDPDVENGIERYTATTIAGQNFVISRMTGNPDNDDCTAPMQRGGTDYFVGSSGEFVCLTGSCPSGYRAGDPMTILKGTIARTAFPDASSPNHHPTLSASWTLLIDGESQFDCRLDNPTAGTAPYTYQCTIARPGWTGFGNWSGDFTLPLGNDLLCPDYSGTATTYATLEPEAGRVALQTVPIGLDGLVLNLRIAKQGGNCSP